MVKIYVSNISKQNLGGGWSFLRNLRKGMEGRAEFVNRWQDCDIVFAFGITAMDKGEIRSAVGAGKKFVLRVDNLPRKSRNPRMSPVERLAEFGGMADAVVYQSRWCREYAGYFINNGSEFVIHNGVDKDVFNTEDRKSDGKTYLYLNYNDNPNKRFDEALYWFDLAWRKDEESHLIVAGNAPKIYAQHPEYNWDLPVPAEVDYVGVLESPEKVAEVMKRCDYLLIPYFAEACSNVLLEGLACGLRPIAVNKEGGNIEIVERYKEGVLPDIRDMADEYLKIFKEIR